MVSSLQSFKGTIERGASVQIEGEVVSHPSSRFIGRTSVGTYTYFGRSCLIGSAIIGRYCSLANSISIGLGEHPVDTISTHPFFFAQRNGFLSFPGSIGIPRDQSDAKYQYPKIGHDVWIGANVVIRRGITIGSGAVIGAGSVVTKDVPPYAIIGGVPAKIIKFRFPQNLIDSLMAAKWWNLPVCYFQDKDISNIAEICETIMDDRASGNISDAAYQSITLPSNIAKL